MHYDQFLSANNDLRLGYLVKLTNDELKIDQRHGSRSPAAAINDVHQLSPVEQRAVAILKGARRKPHKNLIEQRAIQLAEATKEKWLHPPQAGQPGRPKGKWRRKPDATAQSPTTPEFQALKPRLTLQELVSIAAPVIEELAGGKITLRNQTFAALLQIARTYSDIIIRETPGRELRINNKAVQQALSRAR